MSIPWARPPRLCASERHRRQPPVRTPAGTAPSPHTLSRVTSPPPPLPMNLGKLGTAVANQVWRECHVLRARLTAPGALSHQVTRPEPHGGATRRGSGPVPAEVVCQHGPPHVGVKTPPSYPRPAVTSLSKGPGKKQRGRPHPPCYGCSRLSPRGWFAAPRLAGELRALLTGTPGVKVFTFFQSHSEFKIRKKDYFQQAKKAFIPTMRARPP